MFTFSITTTRVPSNIRNSVFFVLILLHMAKNHFPTQIFRTATKEFITKEVSYGATQIR